MNKIKVVIGLSVVLFTVVLLFVSCQSVPITERKQFILVPISTELELGTTTYNDILSESKLSTNAKAVNRIRIIGQRIADATERTDYVWEFNLIDNDEVANAFCLPGGKIAIYTGIMKLASTNAELATVIGHEISHAIARHGAERMTQFLLLELGGMALEVAMKKKTQKTKDLSRIAYGAGTQLLYILPYSRTHEFEADHLGLIYMAKAGYDPRAAVDFWRKMNEEYGDKEPPEFLSTHPNSEQRIRNLEELLPEALEYYK